MSNDDAVSMIGGHPMVQSRKRRDWRNIFDDLPDQVTDNSVVQELEKDDQAVLDKIDEEEGQFRNWIDDYEKTGNYGQEVKELDSDIQGVENEIIDYWGI